MPQAITEYDQNVLACILNNPYRILGIASNATNIEANEALEKIKRLDRLKVINSYKTDYSLAGFPMVSRDLASCQNALASIKNIKHKWFWFCSAEACQNWQSDSYRSSTTISNLSDFIYDVYLAKYLYLLVFDPNFNQRSNWREVFAGYQFIVGEQHVEVLKEKFNNTELEKNNNDTILENFANHIFFPLDILMENAGIDAMLSFFRSIRLNRYPALKNYKRNLAGKIAQWSIAQEKKIWSQIEEYIGIGALDEEAVEHVWDAAQEYDDSIQMVLENILNALTMEPLRAEMVKSSYKKVMEKVMILLLAGGKRGEASRYGRYLYKYADNELKLKIISACGVESIPEAIADLPELSKLIPKNNEKEMVDGSEFDDITICEGDSNLPRVDFCGLLFNDLNVGVRFWISNTTSSELKFWLMDIEVNGQFAASTEILCNVDINEHNYYDYELFLPDNILYSDVTSITFYVEIDRPGNETIYDTEIVNIKCDMITEKMYATYKR